MPRLDARQRRLHRRPVAGLGRRRRRGRSESLRARADCLKWAVNKLDPEIPSAVDIENDRAHATFRSVGQPKWRAEGRPNQLLNPVLGTRSTALSR